MPLDITFFARRAAARSTATRMAPCPGRRRDATAPSTASKAAGTGYALETPGGLTGSRDAARAGSAGAAVRWRIRRRRCDCLTPLCRVGPDRTIEVI